MKEKIYTTKKSGMIAMIGTILLLIFGVYLMIHAAAVNPDQPGIALAAGVLILSFGWIPFLGLRVLKPQEALVLTLFGKYAGTIKGDGFYFVNPFCTSVNPAAKTRLGQSGDVESDSSSRKIMISSSAKKQIPLRLSEKLYNAIAAWAEDDFRSVNGQIEYLLTECVKQRKKNGKYVSDTIDEPIELDIE